MIKKKSSLLLTPKFRNIPCDLLTRPSTMKSALINFSTRPNLTVYFLTDAQGYSLIFWIVHSAATQVSWDGHEAPGRSLVAPLHLQLSQSKWFKEGFQWLHPDSGMEFCQWSP